MGGASAWALRWNSEGRKTVVEPDRAAGGRSGLVFSGKGQDMTGGRTGNRWKGPACLWLAAFIWGSAFVAQRSAMTDGGAGPLTFNGLRWFPGVAVLLPAIAWRARRKGGGVVGRKRDWRALAAGGASCGAVLFGASSLQQMGITTTDAGKAGFITALYLLLVPVFGLTLGRRVGGRTWAGVAVGLAGLWLLCTNGSPAGWNTVGRGDWLLLGCAAAFAVHILLVDRFAGKTDPLELSAVQFAVCGCLSLPFGLALEHPTWAGVWAVRGELAYAGFLSSGVAYTLQTAGQRETAPTVASLILCMESVFAVLTGWFALGETATGREWAGCALMLGAILYCQTGRGRSDDRRTGRMQNA